MSWRFTNGGVFAAGIIIALACVGNAAACPICDSATAHEVRAGLAATGMGKTIAAIVAPFLLLAAGARVYNVGFLNFFRIQSSKP